MAQHCPPSAAPPLRKRARTPSATAARASAPCGPSCSQPASIVQPPTCLCSRRGSGRSGTRCSGPTAAGKLPGTRSPRTPPPAPGPFRVPQQRLNRVPGAPRRHAHAASSNTPTQRTRHATRGRGARRRRVRARTWALRTGSHCKLTPRRRVGRDFRFAQRSRMSLVGSLRRPVRLYSSYGSVGVLGPHAPGARGRVAAPARGVRRAATTELYTAVLRGGCSACWSRRQNWQAAPHADGRVSVSG